MRIWDLTRGAELASFASGNTVTVMAATPTGARVIVGTEAGPVHLVELCEHQYPKARSSTPLAASP